MDPLRQGPRAVLSQQFAIGLAVGLFLALGLLGWAILATGGVTQVLPRILDQRRPATPVAVSTAAPAAAATAAPTPSSTPTPALYRSAPIGPVKIEAGQSYSVPLGFLARATLVRATVSVDFNNRVSYLTGRPDVDVNVVDRTGVLARWARVQNGFELAWEAPRDGEYSLVISNVHSTINAKQVRVVFAMP